MKIVGFSLMLASGICASGCYTSRPELRGTVVNVWTGAPVAGAKVAVKPDALRNPAVAVNTNEKGEFVIPRVSKFGGLKKGRWTYPVEVEADGFAGSSVDVVMSSRKPIERMDDIRFELVETRTTISGK